MKLLYTHPNIALVVQTHALIEHAGIECIIRNQYASGAIGELAPINAWPEVWVMKDKDFERATSIIEESQEQVLGPDWQCAQCSNANPASFDTCWHCGGDRETPA